MSTSMKVTQLASSTVLIKTSDLKILCDPWLENGEYYGSWSMLDRINLKKLSDM